MSQTFGPQDAALLQAHLQAMCAVEFFTIPFYLTAVYSFTDAALNYTDANNQTPLYNLQQETLSVAVQEMYHLQLACNLANAFDVTPQLPQLSLPPNQAITIPHLEENGVPLTAALGNLPEQITAMIEIETPDPNPNYPPPNAQVTYASIADLYHATLTLLAQYYQSYAQTPAALDPHFDPNHNQVAYGAFPTRYQYNTIANREDVIHAVNAITDQGEGSLVAPESNSETSGGVSPQVSQVFKFGANNTVLPEYQAAAGSRFAQWDTTTHYARFQSIQTAINQNWQMILGGAKPFYENMGEPSPDLPSWAPNPDVLQSSLGTIWSFMVDTMQSGFANGNLSPNGATPTQPGFGDTMLAFKYILPLIWQWGFCPNFAYTPGVTAQEVQAAMDAADPLCLFHWDATTAAFRAANPDKLNSCQGLNKCAGQGWGTIATAAGNGACATADMHTCVGSNSCANQGGCGFLSTGGGMCGHSTATLLPPSEQWIPRENQCKSLGGCQSPISAQQVFDRTAAATINGQTINPPWTPAAKQALDNLIGTSVWAQARALFTTLEGGNPLPTPLSQQVGNVNYDGDTRRAAIAPTSK
jgi:hypothetical protein